jgi:predicted GNAT family acetyltransferase
MSHPESDDGDLDDPVVVDDLVVIDVPDKRRYEARIGDRVVGFNEYRPAGTRRVLIHTEVDAAFSGRGVGSRLVRGVLDDLRARGLRVTVHCPFIAAYLERHPGDRDLLANAAG